MCTDKNNDKNKTNLMPPHFQSCFRFLIAEKLLSLSFSSFQTFSLFLLTALQKIKRKCISELFCIANLTEMGRKNISLYFMNF